MIGKSKKIVSFVMLGIGMMFSAFPVNAEEPLWRYLGGNRNPNPEASGLRSVFQEFDARSNYLNTVKIDGISGVLIRTRTVGVTTEGNGIVIAMRDEKGNSRNVSSYLIPCKTVGEKVYYVEDKKWGVAPINEGFLDYICFY
tara:strand:- start:475 stop:900 length:426 start_codon:yes stop_codon:yes gene_type:complete